MIERQQYIRVHWRQYRLLEDDLIQLSNYVDFRQANLNTCSNRIAMLLVSTCALIDSTMRELYELDSTANMKSIANLLLNDPMFNCDTAIRVLPSLANGMILKPWSSLASGINGMVPSWWKAYNSLKHDRFRNYEQGTLENLLTAMSGLYSVEMLYIKRLGAYWYAALGPEGGERTFDVPNDESSLFTIDGWKTRVTVIGYNAYMFQGKDDFIVSFGTEPPDSPSSD